ncbi:hypothetical protein NFI96_027877 [Prochilodus magdalenae]|nr:hypothetical protein NFI96_027877 [Prochilodus magdalenae]
MEDSSEVAVLVPHPRGQQETVFSPEPHLHADQQSQQKQAADSLIQVIEKLSKIVEQRPRRCTQPGKKRPSFSCASVTVADSREGSGGASPCKISRKQVEEGQPRSCSSGPTVEPSVGTPRTVTCYQCSLCRFLSPTLSALKEHLKQHDEQHSDLILMCSECCFTSSHQEELEAHVRLHFEQGTEPRGSLQGQSESEKMPASPKKWYSYEHGRYRCLICSYECRQQRNLKTHAWKHAGLVDCSYPIFEDEDDQHLLNPVPTVSISPSLAHSKEEESIVVLAPVGDKGQVLHSSPSIQLELCAPKGVRSEDDKTRGAEDVESPASNVFSVKGSEHEEPAVEVQMTPEAQMELELETESQQMSADSLLSSAQKIINCSGNGAGHVNVIVERLPCAEEPVASKSLLLSPEVAGDKTLLASKEPGLENQPHSIFYEEQEEVVIGWSSGNTQQETEKGASDDQPPDENMPPARRRTHSECLRLHSLAAEALVAMPTRAPELSKSTVKGVAGLGTQIPDTGQRIIELSAPSTATVHSKSSSGPIPDPASLLNLGLGGVPQTSKEVLVEGPSKAGISMSLLTVIERLRERSDQNATDEDILKELQDNAQSQHSGGTAGVVVGTGDPSVPEGSLVEYIAGSERPYRCRLCLYSSGNKGYIKQHLRVHRQRQPYQCPICEYIASDSKDLESHMIHHCKTRMYPCKHCSETFHYKSQLRNHEREQHGMGDTSAALTAVGETAAGTDESEKMTEEDPASDQKVYKCDVCDYTSSTYVGVRNHRRIHNSDKPYRCCSCDFATTNMNSLKSHMKRHPQEHQAVQLLEQYRCSLCGYVCSHPPSLKSHMWKHAGDQNYNYEQVNKAINEAISQSSRSPVVPPNVVLGRKEKTAANLPTAAAGTLGDAPGARPGEQALQAVGRKGGIGQVRAGMEYCMLLFCCCICGFESTSKEQLMEHMKEHEGDIISIILSKEQQGSQPAEPSTVQ